MQIAIEIYIDNLQIWEVRRLNVKCIQVIEV
jgi:hypothetical protein